MNRIFPTDERAAFFFPEWSTVLDATHLTLARRGALRREILQFLVHCGKRHAPATIALAKDYLTSRGKSEMSRAALRWFFSRGAHVENPVCGAGRAETSQGRPTQNRGQRSIPPLAAADLGQADWERALVTAAREKNFLWRTERTYRD